MRSKIKLSPEAHQVLVSEFEKLSEAFIANEQAGDTRVNLFVTAAAAVLTAFGVSGGPDALTTPTKQVAALVALIFLLILGWFTLNRGLRRNLVTDDYLSKMRKLRVHFETEEPSLKCLLPFPTSETKEPRRLKVRYFFIPKGGMVEVVVFINAAIAGAMGAIVAPWLIECCVNVFETAATALLAILLTWAGQIIYVDWRYAKGVDWPKG